MTMARRVLVAIAAKEEELQRARRALGYERLVLVAPRGRGQTLAQLVSPPPHIVEVPEDDLLGCLEAIEALLREERKAGQLRVAADGGTAAMSQAAFLACLSQGVEAWWLLHRAVRLPVLHALPVAERFHAEEARVLAQLGTGMAYAELARSADLPLERCQRALHSLRKQGAVKTDKDGAEPTALGRYYQRALKAPREGTLPTQSVRQKS